MGGYDFLAYNTPSKLPLGMAGIAAGCFGAVGAVLGMSQVYYTGPVAKHVGIRGADLGFEVRSLVRSHFRCH